MSSWTIYITNDNCPDYTWGYTEEQTRQAFADIVAAHLDEMSRTDGEAPENRSQYNAVITQEALCFVERYPERTDELVRRIREGRLFVSPYLCNSLWAFQSVEGALRTFYPARRLEREWGIPLTVAQHIEEPSLPWGVATILAGCGIRWLSNPFYAYDSTFRELENPPLFTYQGPDGGQVRVVMDPWACLQAAYTQGSKLLGDPSLITETWLPHYQQLSDSYPVRVILASGTHGDIAPNSGEQARGFSEAIARYNSAPGDHPKLVNAALPQFCAAVDEMEAKQPFLTTVRGSFGDSWDLWPVSLAKYVAQLRENERQYLATETLLALASPGHPALREATRADRERAEWLWAMLSDHAWNGTGEDSKRLNAELRRGWNAELSEISARLRAEVRGGATAKPSGDSITLVNTLSVPRAELVRAELPYEVTAVADGDRDLATQIVVEEGRRPCYFVSPEVPGFGASALKLSKGAPGPAPAGGLRAAPTGLESPFYRLVVDVNTGGVRSLVHTPTGAELVAAGAGRSLGQTIYFDGEEHLLRDVTTEVVAEGPVLARLRIAGAVSDIRVATDVTLYLDLDRVDFGLSITKPVATREERLCHVFPVARTLKDLRVESPAAVITPLRQPEGDLLPGADTRRMAVQGFVDASPAPGVRVTIAPLDSFALRLDLDPITFEALGNDQNHREVIHNQNGETEFRFRYSLAAYAGDYDNARAVRWSRSVATLPLALPGCCFGSVLPKPLIRFDPARAIATCLKPADGDPSGGLILRLWEIAGQSGPLEVALSGFSRAVQTDLLERDLKELKTERGTVTVDLRARGFAALRLLP